MKSHSTLRTITVQVNEDLAFLVLLSKVRPHRPRADGERDLRLPSRSPSRQAGWGLTFELWTVELKKRGTLIGTQQNQGHADLRLVDLKLLA